jgi:hypothetical protein
MKYIKELKEWKNLKPHSPYGSKKIKISKIELEGICNKIGISSSNVRFLSSGCFGNAYTYGDKIIKITTDKNEARVAYDLIGKDNLLIVKYYRVYKYVNFYVILMDRVVPIKDYLKSINHFDINWMFIWDLTETLCKNWNNIDKDRYIEEVYKLYKSENRKWNIVGIKKFLLDGVWDIYESIRAHYIDLHPDNLGIKDGNLVCFDLTSASGGKFDEPKNI